MLEAQQQAIEQLQLQLQAQGEELAVLRRSGAPAATDPGAGDASAEPHTVDADAVEYAFFPRWLPCVSGYGYQNSRPSNLYTYAVEIVSSRQSTTLQMMRALGTQPLVQFLKVTMAFAFYDAAWLGELRRRSERVAAPRHTPGGSHCRPCDATP